MNHFPPPEHSQAQKSLLGGPFPRVPALLVPPVPGPVAKWGAAGGGVDIIP